MVELLVLRIGALSSRNYPKRDCDNLLEIPHEFPDLGKWFPMQCEGTTRRCFHSSNRFHPLMRPLVSSSATTPTVLQTCLATTCLLYPPLHPPLPCPFRKTSDLSSSHRMTKPSAHLQGKRTYPPSQTATHSTRTLGPKMRY